MSSTFLLLFLYTYEVTRKQKGVRKMLELYKNIKRFRKELGMSQDKLAQLTGYTDRSSIAKIEKGEVDIPQSKIILFADALNVDPGTLMGDSGIMPTTVSSDEQEMLDLFNSLDDSQQKSALEYLKFLKTQQNPSADNQ